MTESETVSKDKPLFLDIPITNISKNDKEERRIVAGYGSLEVVDRQGDRITNEAMKEALDKFMENPDFANTHVMHGNCAVGKVIPSYTDMNGELWETKVNDTGTFIVSELRPKGESIRADQTWQLIEDGRLKSYSFGGIALNPKERVCEDTGACHFVVDKIEIHEFSYVDRPAVKGADFILVKNEQKVAPMACECPKTAEIKSKFNKHETQKVDIVESIMTKPQAEGNEETVVAVPEPEVVAEAVEEVQADETEKADATPTLLEIKAMLEKLLNAQEHSKEEKVDVSMYPAEQVEALTLKYGDPKSNQLISLLGEEAFSLLDKTITPDDQAVPPIEEKVAEPEKVVEEVVAETVEPTAKVAVAPEPVVAAETEVPDPEPTEKIDKQSVEKIVETTLEKYAQVQKRTPVQGQHQPQSKGLDLFKLFKMNREQVDALASSGA